MIIDEIGGGGTEDAGDFLLAGDEAGEAQGGVTGCVFLIIGGFVGFVDNDEAEVVNGREEGGAGTDDDERLRGGIQ